MHGKNSKVAAAALSALLYGQGLLGLAGVTFVVMKDRMQAERATPAAIVVAASTDAQLR